jgi:hypothetical protein
MSLLAGSPANVSQRAKIILELYGNFW